MHDYLAPSSEKFTPFNLDLNMAVQYSTSKLGIELNPLSVHSTFGYCKWSELAAFGITELEMVFIFIFE